MFLNINKITIIVILCLSLVMFVNFSYAAEPIVPGAPAQSGGEGDSKYETGDYVLNDFIQIAIQVSKFILGIVGSLALLMFIYGGLMMIISQGSSDKVEQSKTILKNAVIGLVIVFTSWTIINFVITAFVPDAELGGKAWYQLSK